MLVTHFARDFPFSHPVLNFRSGLLPRTAVRASSCTTPSRTSRCAPSITAPCRRASRSAIEPLRRASGQSGEQHGRTDHAHSPSLPRSRASGRPVSAHSRVLAGCSPRLKRVVEMACCVTSARGLQRAPEPERPCPTQHGLGALDAVHRSARLDAWQHVCSMISPRPLLTPPLVSLSSTSPLVHHERGDGGRSGDLQRTILPP